MNDMTHTEIAKRDSLTHLCNRCLLFVLHLRSSGRYPEPKILRRRCQELLTEFEDEGVRLGVDPEDLGAMKYALGAFIDEGLLAADWDQKAHWAAHPLQLEIYKSYGSGEKFFELLAKVQDRSKVLEVFFMCMVFGFRGKYRERQGESMQPLIDETRAVLQRLKSQGPSAGTLSPNGYPEDEAQAIFGWQLPLWVTPAAAGVAGLLYYYIKNAGVTDEVAKVLEVMRQVG